MKGNISFWTRTGFGLGRISEGECADLKNAFRKPSLSNAVKEIKKNNSEGYYRNLEYRLSQTIKKDKSGDNKENLKMIHKMLMRYNWINEETSRKMDESSSNESTVNGGASCGESSNATYKIKSNQIKSLQRKKVYEH